MSRPWEPCDRALAAEHPIDPNVQSEHVHLRTADIGRIGEFHVRILGSDVVFEARGVRGWGTTGDILFVTAGGYHHLGFTISKSARPRSTRRSTSTSRSRAARGLM
jgi:catechol-2,3-dioxygenase